MAIAISGLAVASCASRRQSSETVLKPEKIDNVISGPVNFIPKASVFRMSGDYADKVGVTLDGSGNLVYYPAPTDITTSSAPLELEGGWWLNRQGLSANSVFTKWTFEEYAALPSTPTPDEIKRAVIPGARVTAMTTLPMTLQEAMKNREECIKNLPQD